MARRQKTNGDAVTSTPSHTRIAFLDLARLIATLMMVQGHTTDALLGVAYRSGAWFEAWRLVRGLTSPTFLFVSGCVFGVVTVRQLGQAHFHGAAARRLRRFGFFLLLGYALHYPTDNLLHLLTVSQAEWHAFIAIDILQCIAVSLGLLQIAALLVTSRVALVVVAAGIATSVWVLSPVMRWHAVSLGLPDPLLAYLTPEIGSLFPLFPWLSYAALGAAVGAAFGSSVDPVGLLRRIAPLGVLLLVVGAGIRHLALESDLVTLGAARPSHVLLLMGAVCLLLSLLVLVSAAIDRGHQAAVASVAQESLVIYVVHLGVVYGSPWNPGLRQLFGATLSPLAVVLTVIVMWVSMGALAVAWVRLKRRRPHEARVARNVVVSLLLLLLLV
jgi:surface polysaccharide O-acyltransferase-like enzyme